MIKNINSFNNNEGIGGFEVGGYDLHACHPVDANWTRQSRFSLPGQPNLLWKVTVDDAFIDGTNIKTAFVIDKDQNILITDCDNNLSGKHFDRLLNVSPNGEINQLFITERRLKSPVIGYGGFIYVTTCDAMDSRDHKLFCLKNDGTVKWEFLIDYSACSKPVIDQDGNIYIFTYGDREGRLLCISSNGSLRWKRVFNSVNWYESIISKDGIIYVGLNVDKKLYAFDKNGQELWSKSLGQGLGLYPPVIRDDGTIYVNLSGGLFALTPDGEIIWEYKPKDGIVATSPALSKDKSLILNLNRSRLVSLDENGKEIWETKISGATSMPPIIGQDGDLYQQSCMQHYPQYKTWIDAFSKDGSKIWTYETNGDICSTVLADDNLVYALINCYTYKKKGWTDKMIVKWELHAIGKQ